MCPLQQGRSGDKNPKPPLMETEPQSEAQINTWNQAANSYDNSRVSERKHFVKQTVCCLIAVFSHLHSLSLQLSLMWRWSGLGCSGHFLLLCCCCFFCQWKTESLGVNIQSRGMTTNILLSGTRHLACMFSGRAFFALEQCPYWNKLAEMLLRLCYSQFVNVLKNI